MSQHLRRLQKITGPARLSAAKKSFKKLMLPTTTPSEGSSEQRSKASSKPLKGKFLVGSQKTNHQSQPEKGKGTATSFATSTTTSTAKGRKVATSTEVHPYKKPSKKVLIAYRSTVHRPTAGQTTT